MNSTESTSRTLNPRSTFVTVVAWVFIILTGFQTVIGIFDSILLSTGTFKDVQSMVRDPEALKNIPSVMRFIMQHIQIVVIVFLLIAVIMLAASIGLFYRRNWARIVFMGMLAAGILWTLSQTVYQSVFMERMMSGSHMQTTADLQHTFAVFRIVLWIIVLGVCALFAWIIKRLASKDIRQEFTGE